MRFEIGNLGNVDVINLVEDDKQIESSPLLKTLVEKEVFKNKKKQLYMDYSVDSNSKLYVALGKLEDLSVEDVRRIYHNVGKTLMKYKVVKVNIDTQIFNDKQKMAAIEGLLQSTSVFDKYLSEKKVVKTVEVVYVNEDIITLIDEVVNLFDGIEVTRELVNERAINLYPETLANYTKEKLEAVGIKVTVYNLEEIQKLGMDAFLAVATGSEKEPRFIVMEYNNDSDSTFKTALVGKGVTYDTGGYSMKPSTSMETMFCDMAGSATVVGTLYALAKNDIKANVVGIVAAAENAVSGKAYKPGDIISSMAKKTIEVGNTDAEGRITLADALWYAHSEAKADQIIDIATLTGACIVALGEITTGAITNNSELMAKVTKASNEAGEYVWQMPTNDEYRDMVKSDYADLINTNKGVGAGTITAGLFLEAFVNDVPWVHLDIAGTAYSNKPRTYLPQGATGVTVKTLYNLIKNN